MALAKSHPNLSQFAVCNTDLCVFLQRHGKNAMHLVIVRPALSSDWME